MVFYKVALILLFLICTQITSDSNASNEVICNFSTDDVLRKFEKIKDNRNFVKNLSYCEKSNRQLISELIDLDYRYFEYADASIKNDDEFIKRFVLKIPQIMEYASDRILDDEFFMYTASRLYPEILKYASLRLLDNKIFMSKMIKKRAHNFVYASQRLQNNYDVVLLAVKENGEMLKYASDNMRSNKNIVEEAVKSYTPAINFATMVMQKDLTISDIADSIDYSFVSGFDFFLEDNYSGLSVGPGGIRGYRIVNRGKFFYDRNLFDHPYVIRWESASNKSGKNNLREYKIISGRGSFIGWKTDLNEFPKLIQKIEELFKENQLDQNTIDSLSLTSLWKISYKPEIIAFNLYLLRDMKDQYLRPNFANVTSFTAIAVNTGDNWKVTVIHSIFDVDMEIDVRFKNGHERYIIWDLYQSSEYDINSKVLFKIEGKDSEYFELFVKQPNDKYISFYSGGGYNVDSY